MKISVKNWIGKAQLIAFSLIMVLVLGLCVDGFSIVSHAQSQGKVTASSANIRKEPNPSSQKVGSAERDDSVTINHQTTGTDGNTWYQVFVNANTLGYIRSDLVTITDGTTPTTATGSETTNTNEATAGVTAVEPVSASVTGGANVRVRSSASTTSQIVTTVANGSALTVTGQATASDNRVWYQVEFISNGAEVTGFIRSDYVNLSGELKPVTENVQPPATTTPEQPTQEPQEQPEEKKAWETQLQGDKWYLLDMETPGQYEIQYLFDAVDQNGKAYELSQETVKSQKMIIIGLVILIIILCAALALAVYKIKDMMDSEYISQVERDSARRRSPERPQSNQKVMHTVGAEKKPAPGSSNGRPAGNRPAGAPQGGRPNGGAPQGGRPNGGAPQGGRPNGGAPQGGRPNGGAPQGGRPNGGAPQGGRPNGGAPQGGRPNGAPQGGKPGGAQPVGERSAAPRPATQQPQGKPKNFMTDDDEFEFEFLNWDGEEE